MRKRETVDVNKMASGQQYDVSPEEKRLLELQAKRKAVLRAEFLKQISNPHIHATGEAGGVVSSDFF